MPIIFESLLWLPSTLPGTFCSLMNAQRKRINALGGRGMYDGSRRFPWGRDGAVDIAKLLVDGSEDMGDVGELETNGEEGCGLGSCAAVGAEVDAKERGVIPGENVYVVFLPLSASGGMSCNVLGA